MKAIITKYLGATNTKPGRIKASAEGVPSKIYSCEELYHVAKDSGTTEHQVAAKFFAVANRWPCVLASGGLPSGEWAHCFIPNLNR